MHLHGTEALRGIRLRLHPFCLFFDEIPHLRHSYTLKQLSEACNAKFRTQPCLKQGPSKQAMNGPSHLRCILEEARMGPYLTYNKC